MSSDGNASLPVFDEAGKLTDLQVGEVKSLHAAMKEAVQEFSVPLVEALTSITKSPANILGLTTKGRIEQNLDADLVLLDKATLDILAVYSRGKELSK